MNKSKKGISLIVLVITIIVMIILATAIILSLSGSDIRGKAEEAVSSTDMAAAKEVVAVARSEWEVKYEQLKDQYTSTGFYINYKLEKAGIDTSKIASNNAGEIIIAKGENDIYLDEDGNVAIIPEGFVVSNIASEQSVEYGLVIVDNEGNEFVWIPVDNMSMFKRTTTYTGMITEPDSDFAEPYTGFSLSNDPTGEVAEYNALKESVKINKGFYIGRYEAGLPEGKTRYEVKTTDKPISKKGATIWGSITWGTTSMDNVGTGGAVYRAREMYKESKSVVSTLCYGVQWDLALQFISNRGIKDKNYANNSYEKGNYFIDAQVGKKAGSSDAYKLNNIYDMAGNYWEWTMESYSTNTRVHRGGSYMIGSKYPVSYRESEELNLSSGDNSFRVALYIK